MNMDTAMNLDVSYLKKQSMIPAYRTFNLHNEMQRYAWMLYYFLGRAYLNKKFFDLALEQFKLLKADIQIMDERKKDAIYELGLLL